MQNDNSKLKIVFWGTSDFATPTLKKLIAEKYNTVAVFTGQGSIVSLANEHNIKIFQSKSLKDDETFEQFKLLNPDLCIVAAYGKIIPSRYLDIPKYGFINIHPSLLPKYRGPSPIQTAIMNDDGETGVTIMQVDKEMDHGPILASREFPILNFQFSNYKEIEKEMAKLGADLLIETLPKYISGEIKPQEQNHSQATFTKIINREDGRIDWSRPAEKIYNQIRALNPEPGTWTTWNNKILNIKSSQDQFGSWLGEVSRRCKARLRISVDDQNLPGTVMSVDNQIAVATGKCYLVLRTIQLEGGKEIDVKSFLNGHRDFLNSRLE